MLQPQMELLAAIVFLSGLLCSNAQSLPAVLPANCSEIEKDAGVTLDLINKHHRDGFIFALFRVADAHVQHDGKASILYLTLDVLETECSVLTRKYWDSCGHRKFYGFTDFGQCKAVVFVDKLAKRNELYGYNCTLSPVPSRVYECKDCPVRTTVLEDAEQYAGDAERILERFREESNETNYFKLEKVQKVFSAVGSRTVYLIEFTIKETECLRSVDPARRPECDFLPDRDAHTGFCIGRVVHGSKDPDGVELESCDIFHSDYEDSKEHHPHCSVSGHECRYPSHRHCHHHHLHHYPHHHPPHHGHHVPHQHHHHHHHNDSGEHHRHCKVSEHECRHPHPPHRHHHHGHHHHHHPHHDDCYHHHHHHHHHHPHCHRHRHGHRNGHECPTPPEHYHHDHDHHGSSGPTGHHNSSEESQEQHPGPPGPHYPSPPAGGPHHFPPSKFSPPPVGPPPPPDRPHGIPLPPYPCCPPPPPPPSSRLDRQHGHHHHPRCNSTSGKRGKCGSTEDHDSFQDHHSFHHREVGSVYYIPVLGEHDVLQVPGANFPNYPHSPHGGHEEPPLSKKNKVKQPAVHPFPSTSSESTSCPAKPIYDLPKILSLYPSQPEP